MDSRETKLANLVFLVLALLIAAQSTNARPRLPALPVLEWSTVSEVLSCPYMQPPECVVPLPGL